MPATVSSPPVDDIRVRPDAPVARHRKSRVRSLNIKSAILWAPVAAAILYVPVFLYRMPGLIERLYWDSDASVAVVIADTHDRGTTVFSHYGWYTYFWFTQITRPLPMHRQIWEYAPYLIFLTTMAALAYCSYRFAGKWAAAMTATAAIAISPFLSYIAVSLNFHSTTWIGAVLMAVYSVWLTRKRHTNARLAIGVAIGALVAGASFSSDGLFAAVGIAPMLLTGLVLLCLKDARRAGIAMVVTIAVAAVVTKLCNSIMENAHFLIWEARTNFANVDAVLPNFGRLVQLIVMLPGGDKFYGQPLGVRSGLSFLCAAVMLAALACPFIALRQALRAPQRNTSHIAYTAFWAAVVLATCGAYTFTTAGDQPGYYMMGIFYAAVATAPLIVRNSDIKQFVVAGGVGVLALTALVSILDPKTAYHSSKSLIAANVTDIERNASAAGITKGYADYWVAPGIAWATDDKLLVAPVGQCRLPEARDICPGGFNVSSGWYDSAAGGSFLLKDTNSSTMKSDPPDSLGAPAAVHNISPSVTMYVYTYDIAERFNFDNAFWRQAENK